MGATTTGSLDRYPLVRLLCFLEKKRFTGTLRLETTPTPHVVIVQDGVPIELRPGSDQAVAALFLQRGRLTESTYATLLETLARAGADGEQVWTDVGGLTSEELRRGRRYALFSRLTQLFREQRAPFSLTAGPVPPDAHADVAVEPLYLVYQGIRVAYDLPRLEAELAPIAQHALKARGDAPETFSRFGLDEDGQRALRLLQQGYWLLEDLRAALPGKEASTLSTVYAVLAAGLLELAEADSVPRLRPKRPDRPTPPAAQAGAGSETGAPAERSAIPPGEGKRPPRPDTTPELDRKAPPAPDPAPDPAADAGAPPFDSGTSASSGATPPPSGATPPPGAAADPPPGAAPPPPPGAATPPPTGERTASKGPSTSTGQYAKVRLPPLAVRKARLTAQAIREQGELKPEAEELLEEVMQRLEAMDGQSPFELLGLTLETTAVDVRKAYMQLVKRLHPDRLTALGLGELYEAADTLFKRITEANQALSDPDQLEEARRIYQEAESGADPEEAARAIEAEVDFQKGEVYFRKGSMAEAVEHFQRAVEGNPTEGEHHVLLAWARYQQAPREERAEIRGKTLEALYDGLEKSPRCARGHYFVGKLHLEDQNVDSALEAFRKASRLKRNYIEAMREIRLIEMRQRREGSSKNRSTLLEMFTRKKK